MGVQGEQAHHGQRVGVVPGCAGLAVGQQARALGVGDERGHGCAPTGARRRMYGSQERHGSGSPLLKKTADADFSKGTKASGIG